MDHRLSVAPEVVRLSGSLRPLDDVVGLYAGGSLASGDYRPGISDLDLVAMVKTDPDPALQQRLTSLHSELEGSEPNGASVHCAYLPLDDLAELSTEHLVWAFGELFRRPIGGIARAELLGDPVTVFGPPPSSLLPAMDRAAVAQAARAELTYWVEALDKPELWHQDVYVDLGLVTVVRADAAVTEGRLITKREAIKRLDDIGVEPELVAQIARRRAGESVPMTASELEQRADHVKQVLASGIRRLLVPATDQRRSGST